MNRNDEIVECGCCSAGLGPIKGKVPAYCNIDSNKPNPLDCLDDIDNYCGDDRNGKAKVRFCFEKASNGIDIGQIPSSWDVGEIVCDN